MPTGAKAARLSRIAGVPPAHAVSQDESENERARRLAANAEFRHGVGDRAAAARQATVARLELPSTFKATPY